MANINRVKNAINTNSLGGIDSNVDKKEVVRSLLSCDLSRIVNAHSCYNTSPWYKNIYDNETYQRLTCIQSNIANTLLDVKVDLLWGSLRTDSDLITPRLVRDVERNVQAFGMVLLKYDLVGNPSELFAGFINEDVDLYPLEDDNFDIEPRFRIITDNFDYQVNDFGDIISTTVTYNYHVIWKGEEREVQLKQVQTEKWEFNYLYIDGEQVDLDSVGSYPKRFEIFQNVRKLNHQETFIFENSRDLTTIIEHVNAVDSSLTNILYILELGVPVAMLPTEAALTAGSKKLNAMIAKEKQNNNLLNGTVVSSTPNPFEAAKGFTGNTVDDMDIRDFKANRYNGILKNIFNSEDYQEPKYLQPQLEIEQYQKGIDLSIALCCQNMGISVVTLSTDLVAANASADALKERKDFTNATKRSERSIREDQWKEVFKAIPEMNVKLDYNDITLQLDVDSANYIYQQYSTGGLSFQTMMKLNYPDMTNEEIGEEMVAILSDHALGLHNNDTK